MKYVDIPSVVTVKKIAKIRRPVCVSISLRTTPITQDAQQSRTAFANLSVDAMEQVGDDRISKAEKAALEANLADVYEDDAFWQFQSESLVAFATPEMVRTFRLPNHLSDGVQVSDRFQMPPLMRALAFPHSATVLVLGQNGVRVLELTGDRPAGEVSIPGLPESAAAVARKASITGRSPKRRLQGSTGQKVHLMAYARRVDDAMRPYLAGRDEPVIVVANEPMRSVFLSVCSFDNVLEGQPDGVSEESPDKEMAAAVRKLIDAHYAAQIEDLKATFATEAARRRATSKVTDIAKSSTFGGVETLLVNMDAVLPGRIDETDGTVRYEDEGPDSYDIVSELAVRTLMTGGQVLSVRQDDLPEQEPVAAILRHPV